MRASPPVRSPRCPTCPSVLASRRFLFQSPPAHVSALCGPGSNGPASGPVIRRPPGRRPQVLLPLLSCCLSAARHPLLGTPIPPEDSAPSRSAYRTTCAYPRLRDGPCQRFHLPHA